MPSVATKQEEEKRQRKVTEQGNERVGEPTNGVRNRNSTSHLAIVFNIINQETRRRLKGKECRRFSKSRETWHCAMKR
jgi:hypothetical protein